MDPISVAASSIAFAQCIGAIGKGISALERMTNASAEFCDLLNELASLTPLVHQLRALVHRHAAGPQSALSAADADIIAGLQLELTQTVNALESITSQLAAGSPALNKKGQHKIPKLCWHRMRGDAIYLRDKTRLCRANISSSIDLLAASQL